MDTTNDFTGDDGAQPNLVTQLRPVPGGCELLVGGEIDIATVEQFARALGEAEASGGNVVVDLGGVTFLAAAGVDHLVRARGRLDGQGRGVVVRGATGVVARVLRITTDILG